MKTIFIKPSRKLLNFPFSLNSLYLLDRSLMIGWRKNSWNPERVSSVFTFVSVRPSVCTRDTEDTFWPRNLIFGSSDPCNMRKKRIFFFEIFIFTLFIGIFVIFFLFLGTLLEKEITMINTVYLILQLSCFPWKPC